MKNLGAFFALARAQLNRYNGGDPRDAVLADVVSRYYHPTAPSRIAKIAETVPRAQAALFVLTCHYFGGEQPDLVLPIFADAGDVDARTRLVHAGAVTAPDGAPCRTHAWARVVRALGHTPLTTRAFYHGCQVVLGEARALLALADVRGFLPEPEGGPFLPLAPRAVQGLGWVADGDATNPEAIETARLTISRLLADAAAHWPTYGTEQWTADSVAAWAVIVFDYVSDVRRAGA